jgi:4-hydroxy-2-oxoheptanedioate aldolase
MKVRNVARERLEEGEMSLGVGIRTARTVDIAKMMKTAGYDWLFIDLEHGPMSIEFATTLAVAALDTACRLCSTRWRHGCSTMARSAL